MYDIDFILILKKRMAALEVAGAMWTLDVGSRAVPCRLHILTNWPSRFHSEPKIAVADPYYCLRSLRACLEKAWERP